MLYEERCLYLNFSIVYNRICLRTHNIQQGLLFQNIIYILNFVTLISGNYRYSDSLGKINQTAHCLIHEASDLAQIALPSTGA